MGVMNHLTEAEIFGRLKDNLRSAAADCDAIANNPQSAVAFTRMRASLKICEDMCRLAAVFRDDARWFTPGLVMEQAHQIARKWLHRPTVQSKKLFTGLAAALRKIHADLGVLETQATGRIGMIVPKPLEGPVRSGRPIQVPQMPFRKTAGGIILPT